jgi:formamidopyrimidine-DNA glycosylase
MVSASGRLLFDDTRRFGAVECLAADAWAERDRALGPEPLDDAFTAGDLHAALGRSRSPVRSWLLDQRRIAGVGNIYANEALHGAGIDPRRPARSVGRDEARRLHSALRDVLSRAIEARGTTLRDYRDAEGGTGAFAGLLAVYGRHGEPCPRCKAAVERVVFGNRSAFLCPRCQPSRRGTEPDAVPPDVK